MSTNGKIVNKNGKPYWVPDNQSIPEVPSVTSRNQEPTHVKIIPLSKLREKEKDLLGDAYKFLSMPKFYEREDFLKVYQKFHSLTAAKYIEGGFDKFRVACIQARRLGY